MSSRRNGKLTKEEVDALLSATQGSEEGLHGPEEGFQGPETTRRVHNYDFKQPSRFSKAQLEALRHINSGLAQNATAYASRLLRSNVRTQLVSTNQMKWENLVDDIGETGVGFVFLMDDLGYRGMVLMEGPFAAAALDRMMGGQPDNGEKAEVEFTDLDVSVLSGFVKAFLDPLPELWTDIGAFQVELGSFVRDLQTLDSFPPDEDFVQFSFLMQSTVGSGQINLAVPFEAVRSLPSEADQVGQPLSAATEEQAEKALRDNLRRTGVELSVLLGTADVRVGRLVKLEPGDVLVLDSRVGDASPVAVNGKVKFHGFPGVSHGNLAVKLSTQG
jgi:flagellar motor switch protein FliM